jgi:hypothetical protein
MFIKLSTIIYRLYQYYIIIYLHYYQAFFIFNYLNIIYYLISNLYIDVIYIISIDALQILYLFICII